MKLKALQLKHWAAGAFLAIGVSVPCVSADELVVRRIPYKNVQVLDIKGGELVYTSAGGERRVKLGEIDQLKVDQFPQLEKADAAMAKEQWRSAISELSGLSRKGKKWFQNWVNRRLVIALDKDNQYDRALDVYLGLVKSENDPYFLSVMPLNAPKEADKRQKCAEMVEKAIAANRDPEVKKVLDQLQQALKSADGGPIAAIVEKPRSEGGASPDEPFSPTGGGEIGKAIEAGKFKEALNMIEGELKTKKPLYHRLLHQQGLCHAGLGNHLDAALSHMRVVILFPSTNFTYPSLVEAGKAFKEMGDNARARNLWNEALQQTSDAEKRKTVEGLLASLPAS